MICVDCFAEIKAIQRKRLQSRKKIMIGVKMEREKEDPGILKCLICGKEYTSKLRKRDFERHQKRHAKDSSYNPYQRKQIRTMNCEKQNCQAKFSGSDRNRAFRRHMELHEKNPNYEYFARETFDSSRAFPCKVEGCSKYFLRQTELNNHMNFHEGKLVDASIECFESSNYSSKYFRFSFR
jgi:hypothetical protein